MRALFGEFAMQTGRIGRRIAYWRDRRGLTQADFGRLMGQTKRWVQDLEGGKRQTDPRLSVLERAAEVLRIPLEQLLTDDPPVPASVNLPPAEASAVIAALYSRPSDAGGAPLLPDVQRRLLFCCEAFQACHYHALGRDLPALVQQAQHAADATGPDSPAAHVLLSRTMQLAASFLHKYGQAAAVPAGVAADRALTAAERSGDPVAIGAASRRVAKSLSYQGHTEAAVAFAVEAAHRLAPALEAGGPIGLSTLGMLHLSAAIAASAVDRSTAAVRRATSHVDEAAEVASQQGEDRNEDWTMFGPTNVVLHRVDVLARFEDGWSALEATEGLDRAAVGELTPERQAQHQLTMARTNLLTRRKEAAAEALAEADRLAPEEVRGRQSSVNLVKDVLGVTAEPSAGLRALAERCGLRA